jgi:uncharacterized protein YcbK (DUF882 family)
MKHHKKERKQHLEQLFDDWEIEHFSPQEIVRLTNPQWTDDLEMSEYYYPPTKMQKNIKDTILLADRIRGEWGAPVKCISGFRTYLYNAMIDGAESSMHMFFRALDLQPVEVSAYDDFENVCENVVEEYRKENICGFGRYRRSKFVHIDCGHYSKQRSWIQKKN